MCTFLGMMAHAFSTSTQEYIVSTRIARTTETDPVSTSKSSNQLYSRGTWKATLTQEPSTQHTQLDLTSRSVKHGGWHKPLSQEVTAKWSFTEMLLGTPLMSTECESARDRQLVISEQNTDTYATAHLWEGDRCAESNPDNLSPQSTASPAALLPH